MIKYFTVTLLYFSINTKYAMGRKCFNQMQLWLHNMKCEGLVSILDEMLEY